MLIIVAPGQGSQSPGFLKPWLELPGFENRMDWLSAVADIDLVHYGTEADAETILATDIAQPLIVATGLIAALALFPHPADAFGRVGAVAGHSVGELTAAAGARAITAEQAMVLVRERGRAMAAAAAQSDTGMTAIMRADPAVVTPVLTQHGLTAANINGAGQIVAAGTREQLDALAAAPPEGARLTPLPVAGAFHTEHMAPAVEKVAHLSRAVSTHDPRTPVISNRDGHLVLDGRDLVARLVDQISTPVRWDLCMETMADLGVTGVLEIPPAGTLTGLIRRTLPGVETFALKSPDQLDEARAFCERHGEPSPVEGNPTWRLLVAPAKGSFSRCDSQVGDVLAEETTIGTINSLRDTTPVPAPYGGQIIEWLVEDGDLVSPGQPLVRLFPETSPQGVLI